MAEPSLRLIEALRQTADRLDGGAPYRWTHMGSCNCGHLVQTVTNKTAAEIHARALEKAGDWSAQAIDHCPTSGLTIDHIIDARLGLGLGRSDIVELERLGSRRVRQRLDGEVSHKRRSDVVRYMRAWAVLLEEELAEQIAAVGQGGTVRKAPVLSRT
ncbi:MAG: hypothetical protein RL846_25275 [Deltaproteobacteria bacterium]